MTNAQRLQRFIEKQRSHGRKRFSTWLTPEAVAALQAIKKQTRRSSIGEVIEELVSQGLTRH